MTETTSTAPNGEQFPLPTQQDEAAELLRLQAENFELGSVVRRYETLYEELAGVKSGKDPKQRCAVL